jgi:MtN3 and saliva related transmembrane protein
VGNPEGAAGFKAGCTIEGENYMELATVFGVIAGVFTSVRFIPQVYRSFTTRKTTDLSLTFLYFVSAQSLFLILYGITRPEYYVLYMNILPLVSALFLVYLKLKYH